jgi:hypothetical protein
MVAGVATGTAGCSFAGLGTETPAGFEQVNSDRFDVTRTERQYGNSVVAGAALEPGEYLVVPFGVSRDDAGVSLRVEAVQGSVDARLFTRSALARYRESQDSPGRGALALDVVTDVATDGGQLSAGDYRLIFDNTTRLAGDPDGQTEFAFRAHADTVSEAYYAFERALGERDLFSSPLSVNEDRTRWRYRYGQGALDDETVAADMRDVFEVYAAYVPDDADHEGLVASVLRDGDPVATYRVADGLARRYGRDGLLRETYLERIRETNDGVAMLASE